VAHPDHVRARIHALEERLARLRAEKDRLLARASVADRKRNTRRKIVIGGTVLAALEHEGVPQMRTEAELRRWLEGRLTRPHDRAVFDLAPPKSA
jgi:phage shock protein A